ncbi:uncharacterized protein PFL1_05872 [Pseudozyma flocculosa PF-1]|uniref:Related to triacylglycerol lipase n=2 Tax=Pseudozyma flocculosa TaxID=84751 RepID=A0A5C3F4W9_9BASI|nr:uncharacterized protein PFL1_05872 [Pseudozyma flocculosa PF-1]EPQ26550.1 hypothetical protein PFL1_05872 [Pseudozyma flocculosa PF-1]SPO38459.1 related to triacylglycerol lipase precursor [Pseudozyma flocculosa]
MKWATLTLMATLASVASAGPLAPRSDLPPAVLKSSDAAIFSERRDNTASPTALSNYKQYQLPAQLAQGAYCNLPVGGSIADLKILWTAGDGNDIPFVYVGYSPSKGIVVSHQGTNTKSFASILNDVDFFLDPTDSRLSFLGSDVKIHGGFQDTWKATADQVLAQVKAARTKYPNAGVFTTGHSLGAAISLLDALYLKNKLPGVSVTSATFGLPRTGNPEFANAVDGYLPGFVHINNGRDPVPRLPGGGLGFQQVSGEIWINPANGLSAVSCPGQENRNCILSVNPLTFEVDDHTGTYFKVRIAGRGANCPPVISA